VNVSNWAGELLFFPPLIGLAILILSFLVAWLAAGLGVMVSLKAASVRQAQQTLSVAFLVLFVPLLLLPLLPRDLQGTVQNALSNFDVQLIIIIVTITLLLVDLALLAAAFRRFKRTQLIITGN
jgi:ABC-2 type transport system permease protein